MISIGIVGDYKPDLYYHQATDASLRHASRRTGIPVGIRWLPTSSLADGRGREALASCDGLWIAPGSPYQSMEGALEGIRFAREKGIPLVGT